jgi:1,4-alpha-glucan branching enzyme
MTGSLVLVLHAHLPFVRHPEQADFLEEDWLYEAIVEAYLPLLGMLDRIAEDRLPVRLTLSISPTLLAMFEDQLLMKRCADRIDRLCELAEKEVERTASDPQLNQLAQFYRRSFEQRRAEFEDRYRRDLIRPFAALQREGILELITSSATHGFLPLLRTVPSAVWAQLAVGVRHFEAVFGRPPSGIWLPECGYYPGLDGLIAAAGPRFFFVEADGILDASPAPLYGAHAPVYTRTGVAAFGRDPNCSQEVWSATTGFPGDPLYRDFYRDLGWEAESNYIRPYVQPTGDRKAVGIKYFRITGATDSKQLYQPELARERALSHAREFLDSRERQFSALGEAIQGRSPLVVAPYDAELFGHWWYEGPLFLEAVLRDGSRRSNFALRAPADFLRENPENQIAELSLSSWGEGGYAEVWLNAANDWIYPHLHRCGRLMVALAADFPRPDAKQQRALNQAARELLLAQASDWAFILKTGSMPEYAERRTREHIDSFLKLEQQCRKRQIDVDFLDRIESRDNLFPELDYKVYAAKLPEARPVL